MIGLGIGYLNVYWGRLLDILILTGLGIRMDVCKLIMVSIA